MVMIQISEATNSRVRAFRCKIEKIILDKVEDTVSKIGVILASGILDVGGTCFDCNSHGDDLN
ncbi:unnamed protein product [Arabidopsis lyrata]|nr:unnamed protein product [Arabidopsis lyrata]